MDTKNFALQIRKHALSMTSKGKASHIGAIFSMTDILAVLYGGILKVDPANPRAPDRDRFILSKGHAGCGLYAALSERGFFPTSKLSTYYQNGSDLSGHVSHKNVPGVEFSTGSLGHGLSVGTGMALAGKWNLSPHRVFVLMSDGECNEGSTLEPIMFAAHHGLGNLVAIVDYNKIQSLGPTKEIMDLEPFADKWRAFGWGVAEVDGHDHDALRTVFSRLPVSEGKPTCVIAHTVKGKGVSFMENSVLWHYRTAQGAELEAAMRELDGNK